MELKFTPDSFEKEDSNYTGHFVMKVPNIADAWDLKAKLGIDINMKNEIEIKNKSNVSLIANAMRVAKDYIAKVEITRKSDNKKIDNYDDVLNDMGLEDAAMEIATLLISGFKPGKKSKPQSKGK